MAESLGEVVLGVRVDSAQAIAGLNAVRKAAEQGAKNTPQAQIKTPAFPTLRSDYFKGLENSAGTAQAAVNSLGGELLRTVAGLASIGTIAAFFKQSIDAAVELETITKKLSNTLGEGGAAKAINFTKGLANDLGLSFKTLAGSFGSFTAAATSAGVPLKDQEDLFAAVATASQRLGLSSDELKGSLLALQQVAAKGTVQMEELRGQLGERLPVAFGATAKGLGVTQKELIKLVETGQLTSTQFFGALTKGLNELAGASAGAPTVAQSFQQLGNAWDELQTSFGQNLLPGVTQGVKVLQSVIEGLGRKTIADRLGFNTGAIGNLGVLSDSAFNAVEAFGSLQKQFNLTDKQATALFFDAKKSKGFLPDQNLTAQQTDALIAEVERLAQNFRKRFPIQEPIIDQVIVDKTLNTVKKIQDQVKESQQKQSGFTIDSAAFAEAQKEITELGINLRELDGKKAQISAEYTLKGIDSGKITNSIENVQQSLQGLNTAQVTLDIDSSAFRDVTQRIVETQDDLNQLDGKKSIITAEFILQGIQDGAISNSIANVNAELENLRNAQTKLDVDSSEFGLAGRRIVEAEQRLEDLANKQTDIRVQYLIEGLNSGVVEDSLKNINELVSQLDARRITIDIDSRQLDVVIKKLVDAREKQDTINLRSSGKELDALRQGRAEKRVTNSESNLEKEISLLREQQKKVDITSVAYRDLGKEIERLTQLQQKYNATAKKAPIPSGIRLVQKPGSDQKLLPVQFRRPSPEQLQRLRQSQEQARLSFEQSRSFGRLDQSPEQAKTKLEDASRGIKVSLIEGASQAAAKLRQAGDSLRSALLGSFRLLNSSKQQDLLREARQNISDASKFGFDSTKTSRLRSPEDILAAGESAKSLIDANKQLEQQTREAASALSDLRKVAAAQQFIARKDFDNFNAAFNSRFKADPTLRQESRVIDPSARRRVEEEKFAQVLARNAQAVIANTGAISALANKNWDVSLNVNAAGGAATVTTLNNLI